MKKRNVSTTCLFVLVVGLTLTSAKNVIAADRQPAGKPNIVLFLVDDMGWMDSTPYGSKYYETPNMKRLERQSMRFTDAYAVPLCSPTHASILSAIKVNRHPRAGGDAIVYGYSPETVGNLRVEKRIE